MIFIYGVAYFVSTASYYSGEDLAVHGDLIVVTINYRLGTLGFLSTGADVIYHIIHFVKLNTCKFVFFHRQIRLSLEHRILLVYITGRQVFSKKFLYLLFNIIFYNVPVPF